MIAMLFSDADNTLWETDAVYRRAHLWLFSETSGRLGLQYDIKDPIAFVREVDQELAHSHPAHLGYPPSLLVRALLKRLSAEVEGDWSENVIVEIATEFARLTGELPVLREGVIEGLERLHVLGYPVHVMTEGSVERCTQRLRHYNISDYVQSVEKVIKDRAHFARLRSAMPPDTIGWVVGDLLTRDIMPAREAGFKTIYFPGSFLPRWEKSAAIEPDVIQVKTFAAVPEILERVALEASSYSDATHGH